MKTEYIIYGVKSKLFLSFMTYSDGSIMDDHFELLALDKAHRFTTKLAAYLALMNHVVFSEEDARQEFNIITEDEALVYEIIDL